MDAITTAVLLLVMSFLPPAIYVIWIRNTEKYSRERWVPIIVCFLWGATIAVIAALILEVLLGIPLAVSINDANVLVILTAVVIAPFAEELTKPLVLKFNIVRKELDELEDGLIYGAVAGLGFAATENLLYGYSFLSYGLASFFVLMIIRSFAGCLLHASATAWTGYGFGSSIMKKLPFGRVIPYFILAICIHGFYNLMVSFTSLSGFIAGFVIAMIFVAISIQTVRKKIKTLDLKKPG